jgi:hypothetical protein
VLSRKYAFEHSGQPRCFSAEPILISAPSATLALNASSEGADQKWGRNKKGDLSIALMGDNEFLIEC